MTRWKLAIILKDKILVSNEFNWDMYPDEWWYWKTAFDMLTKVKDEKSFISTVEKFNKKAHNYGKEDMNFYELPLDNLDFNIDYYDNRFSDYVYIKNISWEKQTLIFDKDKQLLLEDWETTTTHFWNYHELTEWILVDEDWEEYIDPDTQRELDDEHIADMVRQWYSSWELSNWWWWELSISR